MQQFGTITVGFPDFELRWSWHRLDDGSWITAMGSDDLASGDAAVARGASGDAAVTEEDGSWISAIPSDAIASGTAAVT